MKIASFGISDIGMKRKGNEDAFAMNDVLHLFMIADGMGGHAGGEFASRYAVSTVEEVMKLYVDGPEKHVFFFHGENDRTVSPEEALATAIRMANDRVYAESQANPKLRGMGTTSIIIYFQGNKAYLAHVGDSRIYRVRGGVIKQMTDDHSLVNEQLRQGVITEEEAKGHQLKNVITRSIGIQEHIEVDTIALDLRAGDRFLLCSDGLCNMVEDIVMCELLNAFDLRSAGRRLIELANQAGGDDNISVILLEIRELD